RLRPPSNPPQRKEPNFMNENGSQTSVPHPVQNSVPPPVSAPPPPALTSPPLANPLSHLSTPFVPLDYIAKGFHLQATIAPDQVVASAQELDREGFSLDTITGVDWLAENQMEVAYDYFHLRKNLR